MNLFYSIAYQLGFAPWERAATHPPAAGHVAALFAREEEGRKPPFGKALDIGCGRGHWTLALERRGWEVTGIDVVAKAVRAARKRAVDAGANVTFVEGDITRASQAGIGSGFRLFWDFGTLHGLGPEQRTAAGREITAIAAHAAVILMLAWKPARRGPLPHGVSETDVRDMFPDWRITHTEPFDSTGLPPPLRRADPRVYRLQRR